MAGSAGRVQTPARVQLLQLQRPRSLVELCHRENEWRLLGFRRRQLRRPQRGGAPTSGANRLEPPRYLRRNEVADRLGEPARLLLIPIAFQQRLQVVNGRNRVEQLARHVSRGLVRGNAHGLVIVLNDVIDERPVHVLTEHQADGRVLVFTALIVV